jgi:hypothetical protein
MSDMESQSLGLAPQDDGKPTFQPKEETPKDDEIIEIDNPDQSASKGAEDGEKKIEKRKLDDEEEKGDDGLKQTTLDGVVTSDKESTGRGEKKEEVEDEEGKKDDEPASKKAKTESNGYGSSLHSTMIALTWPGIVTPMVTRRKATQRPRMNPPPLPPNQPPKPSPTTPPSPKKRLQAPHPKPQNQKKQSPAFPLLQPTPPQ